MLTLEEAKKKAYDHAYTEDTISLIRRFEIKNDTVTGLLEVNYATISTQEFMGIRLSPDVIVCDITPKEYQQILKKKRKLPEDWKLKEILFDGTFVYNNFSQMIEAIRQWPYSVEIDDDPLQRILGFKCKTGRKWKISLNDLKMTPIKIKKEWIQTQVGKEMFVNFLNMKMPYTSHQFCS
jgi:hypothetical protein